MLFCNLYQVGRDLFRKLFSMGTPTSGKPISTVEWINMWFLCMVLPDSRVQIVAGRDVARGDYDGQD